MASKAASRAGNSRLHDLLHHVVEDTVVIVPENAGGGAELGWSLRASRPGRLRDASVNGRPQRNGRDTAKSRHTKPGLQANWHFILQTFSANR
jgi:hypothetical protein